MYRFDLVTIYVQHLNQMENYLDSLKMGIGVKSKQIFFSPSFCILFIDGTELEGSIIGVFILNTKKLDKCKFKISILLEHPLCLIICTA